MRIFVATGIAVPEIGGPATYLEGLAPELRARGHELRVLAYGDQPPELPSDGVTRVSRGPLPLRLVRYASAYRRGASCADLVLVLSLGLPRLGRGGGPVALRIAGDYAWERAVNRRWIAPGEALETFQSGRHGWRVEATKRWRARETRRADRVIVPSRFVRDLVVGWGLDPRSVDVIPNAVLPDPVAAATSRLEARRRLGWAPEGSYLVAAARLTPWKGIDLVVEAAGRVGVRLVVIGDGAEAPRLIARATDRGVAATFCGALSRADLALRLRAADYLVVYSAYEGLSHTLLEALALGTPVIASRRGGNPEVVRHEVNGLLVPHPDVGALTAALRHAFAPEVREQLAAGAADDPQRFQWQRFCSRTAEVLEETAGRSSNRRPRERAGR